MNRLISIRGARLHNLKNINLAVPKFQLVVLTGLSGSGKSTLGFDILYKEGQRQYMESLGLVTFGVGKAPVEAISGLSPTVSVDQHLSNYSPRSTVGTVTDIYTYLRVLFARLGHRVCPNCGKDVPPPFEANNGEWDAEGSDEADLVGEDTYPCPHCQVHMAVLGMAHFSFNKPEGACPTCTGLGVIHEANLTRLVDQEKSIPEGAVTGWDINYINYHSATLQAAADYYGFEMDLTKTVKDYSPSLRDLLFYGAESAQFRRHFPGREPPPTVRKGRFEGITANLLRRYGEHIRDADYRDKLDEFLVTQTCPDCLGTRLRVESRSVMVRGETIMALSKLPLTELAFWLTELKASLNGDEMIIGEAILADLEERIARIVETGAGYLMLERASPTLSAGEAQRLRLAALLGSELTGVVYIFDEPTIGLHQRDTSKLIELLQRLRDRGNTVLVIEHDLEMIAAADTVVDFGPGAGKHGGQIVAVGAPEEICGEPESLTGDYLAGRKKILVPEQRMRADGEAITIHGARHHNLQDISVRIPLGVLTAVTGVSGSGKSSLIFDILDRAMRQRLYGAGDSPGEHDLIEGTQLIDKIITIDQAHIGRIPRSNAATYTDVFTPIREAFAATVQARQQGFTARRFSFNAPGGRCEHCEGAGMLTVKMHFLPDVEVRCPACHGKRFTRETLAVRYREHDISQALDLTIEEALELFDELPAARSRLQVLYDIGLGYLQLGQPATTLSGGEAQRIKLAKELGKRSTGRTLYLLDEPTTGLHLADIARLLSVLQRMVEAGSSIIVVEHNLELVKTADWVIDLGPEGGAAGGRLIAQGTPEQVARTPGSYTGQGLRKLLEI